MSSSKSISSKKKSKKQQARRNRINKLARAFAYNLLQTGGDAAAPGKPQ